MRTIVFVASLLLSLAAMAFGSARIDGKIITDGMTAAEVRAKVGQPDSVVQIQNRYGAVIGERWEYYRGNHAALITVSNGKVVEVIEQ